MKKLSKIILLCLIAMPLLVDAGRKYRKSLCTRLSERLCKLLFMTTIVGAQAENFVLDCTTISGDVSLHRAAFECDPFKIIWLLNEGYSPYAREVCDVIDLDKCNPDKTAPIEEQFMCRGGKKKWYQERTRSLAEWVIGVKYSRNYWMPIFERTPEEIAVEQVALASFEEDKNSCMKAVEILHSVSK